jgi:hypothetical protein
LPLSAVVAAHVSAAKIDISIARSGLSAKSLLCHYWFSALAPLIEGP